MRHQDAPQGCFQCVLSISFLTSILGRPGVVLWRSLVKEQPNFRHLCWLFLREHKYLCEQGWSDAFHEVQMDLYYDCNTYNNYIHIYIYIHTCIAAPPSGTRTDKCVLLGWLVNFFGKRADSENQLISSNGLKGNYVETFFQVARFCAVFSLASPFPTCAQTYNTSICPSQPWCASMWLGLTPTCFHNVSVESWKMAGAQMNDVTDMQLLICAKKSRI